MVTMLRLRISIKQNLLAPGAQEVLESDGGRWSCVIDVCVYKLIKRNLK